MGPAPMGPASAGEARGSCVGDMNPEEASEHELERRFSAFVASHRDRARRLAFRLVGGDEAAAEPGCRKDPIATFS